MNNESKIILKELMEEDLKRELERNELATKMAMAKEQEAQEAKRRFYLYFVLIKFLIFHI